MKNSLYIVILLLISNYTSPPFQGVSGMRNQTITYNTCKLYHMRNFISNN